MTPSERSQVVSETLLEVAGALKEGAAGPTHYWFNQLAERLIERSKKHEALSSDKTTAK